MRKLTTDTANRVRSVLKGNPNPHEAESTVAAFRRHPATDAAGALVTLIAEFGPWSELLSRELERVIASSPGLAMRQRLDVGERLSKRQALGALEREGNRWPFVAMLSQHPNGFVRESAVRQLAYLGDPRGLPFLFSRQSDWVPEVAKAAAEGYELLWRKSGLSQDSAWLWAVATGKRMRGMGRQLLSRLLESKGAHVAAVTHSVKSAKYVLDGVRELSEEDPMFQAAMESLHGAIRVEAARRLNTGENPLRWATHFIQDRFPKIREIALDMAVAAGEPGRPLIEAARLDANEGVRSQVRLLLGPGDYASFYRAALPSPAAVAGLGETGTRADAEFLSPLLEHPRPSVRRAAVRALARLDARETTDAVRGRLADTSARVVREAVLALRHLNASTEPEHVEALLRIPDRPPGARRATLAATELMSRWDAAILLLEFAQDPDLADAVLVRLTNWAERMRYLAVRPRPETLAIFERRLPMALLPLDLTDSLRDQARRWM